MVAAKDEFTGVLTYKPVTHLFSYDDDRTTYDLVLKDVDGDLETLEVTDNHPFNVLGQGWVDSIDLVAGMQVPNVDDGLLTVVSLTPLEASPVTYNFTVADYHTYFVGEMGAWVHNTGGCICGAGNSTKYADYNSNADVPEKYSSDPRFDDFAADPAHAGAITTKTRIEAMTGLDAESRGLIKGPITRGPAEIEFFDKDGTPWDVKAPPSSRSDIDFKFVLKDVINSITKELRKKGDPAGTFPNSITGKPEPRRILLNTTYLNDSHYKSVKERLNQELTKDELSRIVEIITED